jgi:hypothetical protein
VQLIIELLVDPAYLVFADALQSQRLGQGVDVAGR